MKVTFLNVGQGDSIVIEWLIDKKNYIGIIDCCKYNKENPVVNFLRNKENYSIKFILLSHPHFDHYSGYLELLDFVEENNIDIKYFIHTIEKIDPRYLKWNEIDEEKASLLENILDKINYLIDEKQLIESVQYSIENWQIDLSATHFLKSLSPSDRERTEFYSKINFFEKKDWTLCSSAMNYLCSILCIVNKETNESILFTSDALRYSFIRLENDNLGFNHFQIPHHGSVYSHYDKFWEKLRIDEPKQGIISAGINKKYNHPDYDVVRFFDELGINLLSTNYVNGFQEYFDQIDSNILDKIRSLDDISEPVVDSYLGIEEGIEILI